MAVFQPTFFTWTTKYPNSGERINLGESYGYTAGPTAPDQRIFVVRLQGMQYIVTSGALNLVSTPERNMAIFEAFYMTHKMHVAFDFPHPIYGTLSCKFNRPLEIPEGIPGGNGFFDTIEVELVEMP